MAWIGTLSPANELAVRMALCQTNPWCREDKAWQLRIGALETEFIHSSADRARFAERAATMARDMDAAVREMKEQALAPPPVPSEPR